MQRERIYPARCNGIDLRQLPTTILAWTSGSRDDGELILPSSLFYGPVVSGDWGIFTLAIFNLSSLSATAILHVFFTIAGTLTLPAQSSLQVSNGTADTPLLDAELEKSTSSASNIEGGETVPSITVRVC